MGLSAFEFIHPNDRERTQKWYKDSVVRQTKSGTIENRQVSRNGKIRHMFWTSNFHYAADGTLLGTTGIARDITERKRIERLLQQAQKMEAIGTLAEGIAHDFNNILFPIVGLADLLLEDLPKGSHEYENAKEILLAGKRGSDLVKQILAFSRQAEHKKMPIRIQNVLKEALKLLRSTIPKNIEITQDIQSDCRLMMADPTKIHQIIMNLTTNAYHAVEPNDGKISIQLREIKLADDDLTGSLHQAGQYAKLTVSDTGCGMEPAVMDKKY